MRAAVFHGERKPLSLEDLDVPTLGAGEALVRTAACGVCATDLHYLHGIPTFKKPPIVLGHEISGIVAEVAPGVAPWTSGDRVLVPPVLSCGTCVRCSEGRDNICERMRMVGNHVDGGFAEYLKVPAHMLVPLPADLPLQESAIISDAVSTPFHAVVNRGNVRPGEWAAIFGCGGVGLNAVQIAAAVGAAVIAVDVDPRKLDLAKRLGAVKTFNSKEHNVPKAIREVTDGGADAAFEAVGKPAVQDQAFQSVRPGGRLVLVGYSSENWNLNVGRVMFREIAVLGSLGCRAADFPRVIELVQQQRVRLGPVVSERVPLEKVNDALQALEAGAAIGRQLVVF